MDVKPGNRFFLLIQWGELWGEFKTLQEAQDEATTVNGAIWEVTLHSQHPIEWTEDKAQQQELEGLE